MKSETTRSERLRTDGNRIVITSAFDPRYQRSAEGELLGTLQTMIEETKNGNFVLDLHERDTFPSMLIGIIMEARQRVIARGGTMQLYIRPSHLKSLQWIGLQRAFDETGSHTTEEGELFLEFTSKPTS